MAFDGVEVFFAFRVSSDVRSWWPIVLAMTLCVSAMYAFLFSIIESRVTSRYTIIFNLLYRVVHLAFIYLFFTRIKDWTAINYGLSSLSLFEKVLYSDLAYYCIPIVALAVHFLLARMLYRRPSQSLKGEAR